MLHEIIADNDRLLVPHVIKGAVQLDAAVEHRSRASGSTVMTPSIDLDSLIWPRSQPGPAFDTPLAEIVDFLVEVGKTSIWTKLAAIPQKAVIALHNVSDMAMIPTRRPRSAARAIGKLKTV